MSTSELHEQISAPHGRRDLVEPVGPRRVADLGTELAERLAVGRVVVTAAILELLHDPLAQLRRDRVQAPVGVDAHLLAGLQDERGVAKHQPLKLVAVDAHHRHGGGGPSVSPSPVQPASCCSLTVSIAVKGRSAGGPIATQWSESVLRTLPTSRGRSLRAAEAGGGEQQVPASTAGRSAGRRSVTVTRYLLGFLAAPVFTAASAARRR